MRTRLLLKTTYWAGFLFSLHVAITVFVNSSFLSSRIPEDLVGLLYSGSAALAIIGLFFVPKLINRFGTHMILGILLAVNLINLGVLAFAQNIIPVIVSFVLYFAFNTLTYLSFDIVVERLSSDENQGGVRGSYLTLMNAGYVLAPLMGGFLLDRLGFSALYVISGVLMVPVIMLMVGSVPSIKTVHPSKTSPLSLVRRFAKYPKLRNPLAVNLILQFFYAWMVIYVPLYLHETAGIPWDTIGIMFAIMLIPFVVIQYPLGKLIDRLRIDGGVMAFGLCLMAVACLLIIRAPHATVVSVTIMLLMSRVGASMVEVASESYFFRHVRRDDTGSMGFFRNTFPLAYIIAPIAGSLIISQGSFRILLIVLALICLVGIIPALRSK